MTTKIKICGITREDDALVAARLGADFLGFIFVPSTPRYVEPERAAEIANAVRLDGEAPKFVGVFRDASNDYIRSIARLIGLDTVQLHGAESEDDIRELGIPAVKTLRVRDELPDTRTTPSAAWLLFDTYDERRAGGTGRRFDWGVLTSYERSKPFFLSGGLGPDNIAAAISLVRPDAIDVGSGVEDSPGRKDPGKLRALFERIKRS